MTCYRKGDCGPYNQTPCCECPASHPEYLTMSENELYKIEAEPFTGTTPLEAVLAALEDKVDAAFEGLRMGVTTSERLAGKVDGLQLAIQTIKACPHYKGKR